jgi:hypothetical protein
MCGRRVLSKETDNYFTRLTSGFVSARLPFSEDVFVNARKFLAFDGIHLEVESPLLDVFAHVASIRRISIRFP